MVHGNFPFHFGGDFYPTRSGFEDPNQRPMQPYYHPYSLTPSQVQYGPNSVDFGGSSQSSSMSGSASATPSPGSTEQQTSWSARPCSGVGSSDPRNKKVMLFEAEVCCAMKKYLGAKQQKRRHAIRFTFHHENTNVIPKRMCLWCKCGSKIDAILSCSHYAAQHSLDNKQNCR